MLLRRIGLCGEATRAPPEAWQTAGRAALAARHAPAGASSKAKNPSFLTICLSPRIPVLIAHRIPTLFATRHPFFCPLTVPETLWHKSSRTSETRQSACRDQRVGLDGPPPLPWRYPGSSLPQTNLRSTFGRMVLAIGRAKIQPLGNNADGFTLLAGDRTGISFTNGLAEHRALASQILAQRVRRRRGRRGWGRALCPWTPVAGAVSPNTTGTAGAPRYFRSQDTRF